MSNIFGERLKSARKAQKLSQEDLANMLNVSRTTVTNWESGMNKPQTNEQMSKLADVLEVSMDYLYGKENILNDDFESQYKKVEKVIITDNNQELEKLKEEIIILRAKYEAAKELAEAHGRGMSGRNNPDSKTA